MRNLIMTGAAVLVLGGLVASCTHDETDYASIVDAKLQAYQEVFVDAYGQIDPNQTWGFNMTPTTNEGDATTRAMMRASMPSAPTFRPVSTITEPTTPDFSGTVPAGTPYAKTVALAGSWSSNPAVYIDGDYNYVTDGTSGLTIYVKGDVTFDGIVSQNSPRTKIVVTKRSTLRLENVRNNIDVYLADSATLDLSVATYGATFNNGFVYMSANSNLTGGTVSFFNGTKVLNNGGTIDVDELAVDKQSTLWNNGSISVTNSLNCQNEQAYLYNASGKTITAKKLSLINNEDLLYNYGTITATDSVSMHNSSAEIVNMGTLNSACLSMAAGGKMHNVGTTNITGKTKLTNENSQWQNDGQYTSGSFDVDNYSKKNYNNCYLRVTGNFFLNRGEFVLNEGASVVAGSFTWEDTSNFWMNSKSLVKIAGTLLTHNCNSDYGFRGVGEEYAVIQAGSVTIESNDQYRMSYFGNLYIDTKTHFGQWYKDDDDSKGQPAYYYDATVKFSFTDTADQNVVASAAPVSIPSGGCSPGYNSTEIPIDRADTSEDKITIVTTVEHLQKKQLIEQGRVFCEDLGQISTNDLDFNDVVFDAYVYKITPQTRTTVTADGVEESKTTVDGTPTYETEIVLLAAGGTLQLNLAGMEVHNKLGSNPVSSIINTAKNSEGAYSNPYFTEDPVVLGTTFSYSSIVEIPIKVFYTNGKTLELKAEQGWAPHKILVPIGTKWPLERVNIADAYTDFRSYVGTSSKFWEGNIVSSLLYSHPKDTYQPRSEEAVVTLLSTDAPVTSYRSTGTSTTTGGYEGETVLSRQLR